MNKYLYNYKHKNITSILGTLLCVMFFTTSCNDDPLGDSFYTFTGQTVGQYIEDNSDQFSEFESLLDTTGMLSLLKAYGAYTCFLPDNAAMYNYYAQNDKASLSDFSIDELKNIALNNLVDDTELTSELFMDGASGYYTMSGRELTFTINSDSSGIVYSIFTNSSIVSRDIDLHNGIIHTVDEVLNPSDSTVISLIDNDENFTLFAKALDLTSLSKSLIETEDYSYEAPLSIDGVTDGDADWNGIVRIPQRRLKGFTILMESDETYANNGITSIEELQAYAKDIYDAVYPEDADVTDVTDSKNSLNRFMAYHIINKRISQRFFIDRYDNTSINNAANNKSHSVKTADEAYNMYEYIETLCPNTLIAVHVDRVSNESNLINKVENTGELIRFVDDNVDNIALNGYLHEIDGILTYNKDFSNELSSKRLRFDVLSFFPELANNNIRGEVTPVDEYHKWLIPNGYIDGITSTDATTISIFSSDKAPNYQSNEIFIVGVADFATETLPIPAGTYEVRYGYATNGKRGTYQIYFDGSPCGIPLNLNTSLTDPSIGYETPGENDNDLEGYQNDKMMRNRGYMKAPSCFKAIDGGWGHSTVSSRLNSNCIRRILGTYTFDEMTKHEIRCKSVGADSNPSQEFMFDYIEFVPTAIIESEGVE